MSDQLPKVAIIYLSWFSMDYIEEVFSCLDKLDYPRDRLEIIVVDNASTDGSKEWLAKRTDITYFSNDKNLGFAEGNNMGINHALLHGADYVFLHNNDLKLEPAAIREAVVLAESDKTIGSVQSFMKLWSDPERVNSTGGMVHFLGFGFVRDNGALASDVAAKDGSEIAYASGAAVLYRASALREVGLLDPFLFLYHEDLELGWRIRLAGFRNVFAKNSVTYHNYKFKRAFAKFYWMERNRYIVHFTHLKLATIVLLAPFLFGMECMMLVLSLKGGWWKEKFSAYLEAFRPAVWKHIFEGRKKSSHIRQVSDREIVRMFTSKVEHQETSSFIVDKIGNPLLTIVWFVLKRVIWW
jgi:GT2 family glycosyltransferase